MAETVVLKVAMSCQGCAGAVQRALTKMEGVDSFNVDLKEQKVTVTGNVKPDDVFQTVSKTGKKTSFWEAEPETKTEAAPAVTETKIEAPPAVAEIKIEAPAVPETKTEAPPAVPETKTEAPPAVPEAKTAAQPASTDTAEKTVAAAIPAPTTASS